MEAKTITVQRTKIIPFDFDLAMAISRGEKEGEIIFQKDEKQKAIIVHVSNMDESYPLLVVIQNRAAEFDGWFNKEGERSNYPNDKLYIKLKEAETFKDKDILASDSGFIFILDTNGKFKTSMHVGLYTNEGLTFGGAAKEDDIERFKRADMRECSKIMYALAKSDDIRAIKLLKELRRVKGDIDLKPFDKVLIKDEENDKWEASFFIRKVGELYECMLGLKYKYCVPFEGNEHLLEDE